MIRKTSNQTVKSAISYRPFWLPTRTITVDTNPMIAERVVERAHGKQLASKWRTGSAAGMCGENRRRDLRYEALGRGTTSMDGVNGMVVLD